MRLLIISIMDLSGNVLFKGKLTSLPLKDECVINKSIELFNDSEPCIINRTFVMKKIYMVIDDYLNKTLENDQKEVLFELLPPDLIEVLDFKVKPYKITF